MTLNDMVKMLDELSPDELRYLREQIDQREQENASIREPEDMPIEEWIARMENAAAEIRAGFTDEEWEQVERDMNEEYIEPWDESEWSE